MHRSILLLLSPVAPFPGGLLFGVDQVRCGTLCLGDGVDEGGSRFSPVRSPSLVVHRRDHHARTGLTRGQLAGLKRIRGYL